MEYEQAFKENVTCYDKCKLPNIIINIKYKVFNIKNKSMEKQTGEKAFDVNTSISLQCWTKV